VSETDSTIAPPPPPALELEVHGRPIPKGAVSAFVVPGKSGKRARAVVVQGGSKSRRSALNEWQSAIQDAALVAMGARELEIARFAGVAVAVEITFRLGRPKSHYGTGRNAGKLKPDAPSFPIGTPDVDKLARAALDALIGTAFDDDSRVVDLHPRKVYAYAGDTEGAWIRIRAASELALVRPNVPILSIVPDTLRAQGGAGTLGELLGLATCRVTTPTARATKSAELAPPPVTTPTERVRALTQGTLFEVEAKAFPSGRRTHVADRHAGPIATAVREAEIVFVRDESLDVFGAEPVSPVDYRALETLDSAIARGDRGELARRLLAADPGSNDERRCIAALATNAPTAEDDFG